VRELTRCQPGASKPAFLWLPSQNGLFADWPQRHR
jgi:hypothetical protein